MPSSRQAGQQGFGRSQTARKEPQNKPQTSLQTGEITNPLVPFADRSACEIPRARDGAVFALNSDFLEFSFRDSSQVSNATRGKTFKNPAKLRRETLAKLVNKLAKIR